MNKIPTAKEFLKQQYEKLNIKWADGDLKTWRNEDVIILKEFAKLHVEAALKSASREVNLPYKERTRFILNAYPLNNIK